MASPPFLAFVSTTCLPLGYQPFLSAAQLPNHPHTIYHTVQKRIDYTDVCNRYTFKKKPKASPYPLSTVKKKEKKTIPPFYPFFTPSHFFRYGAWNMSMNMNMNMRIKKT